MRGIKGGGVLRAEAQNEPEKIERQKNMKTMNRVLAAAAVAAVLGLASSVMADDVTAASPKVRMQLNERSARPVATPMVTVMVKKAAPADLAASPKVAMMHAERTQMRVPGVEEPSTTTPAYAGISAPPKAYQQMVGRERSFEIAPVK